MNKWVKLVAVLVIAASVVSCSTRKKQEAVNVESSDVVPVGTPSDITNAFMEKANQLGIANSGRYNWDDLLSNRTVYFEFDSNVLDSESALIVEAHATYLVSKGGTVSLEGHTDESGTNEYNLALGERRAIEVEKTMGVFGATASNVVSYGEESLAGSEDWRNRRAEIVY